MQAYQLRTLINNSKILMLTGIPLSIMVLVFGYLVYQINDISVSLNKVLEQDSSFYKTKTRENSSLLQVEESNSNSVSNHDSISQQLMLNNVSSTASTELLGSGTGNNSVQNIRTDNSHIK
jgi:hypothetical protein